MRGAFSGIQALAPFWITTVAIPSASPLTGEPYLLIRHFIGANRRFTALLVETSSRALGSIDDSEQSFYEELQGLRPERIVEIGGANRPLFSLGTAREYVGIDIDGGVRWESIYTAYHNQSAELPIPDLQGDLIVSKYVLEHIPDNRRLFANIRQWLAPGGRSVHLFPCGWHPYSVANRLVGNRLAKILIPILRPGSEGVTGYPAYYHLCNSMALERLLKELGLRYRIRYFYGAEDYFGFFAPLGVLVHLFNRVCAALGLTVFASNAVLVIEG